MFEVIVAFLVMTVRSTLYGMTLRPKDLRSFGAYIHWATKTAARTWKDKEDYILLNGLTVRQVAAQTGLSKEEVGDMLWRGHQVALALVPEMVPEDTPWRDAKKVTLQAHKELASKLVAEQEQQQPN